METTPHLAKNLKLFGLCLETLVEQHSAALNAVLKLAESQPTNQLALHTSRHFGYDCGPLEWAVVITSAAGRRTHEIAQRSSIGPVLLDGKIYYHDRS